MELWDMWQHQSDTWQHILLLVLASCLYVGVPGL
jgi:hypothetical protein